MAIPHETVAQLDVEGISHPQDLVEFNKDSLKQVASNLRNPGGRVPNPDPNAPAGATIARPPFVFGAKSQDRLLAAADCFRFYETIGRNLAPSCITYNPIIRNFSQQWKALKDRKDSDDPKVPKLTKALPIIKWTEAFTDYLSRKIGVRKIPLAYVVRELQAVPVAVPAQATDMPHTTEHGSVEADLIARASHAHPLYRDDNAQVYYDLEIALRGTSYLASIKPFQRTKNGRAAFTSIKSQYAGEDKWQAELKKQVDLVTNRVWKGQGNFPLERFIAQHRNAYVLLQECALHVPYQLPNQFTRVTNLLDGIQCEFAPLQAAMALVRNDRTVGPPAGKMHDFEATASFIIPHDPVAKRRQEGKKRGSAEISDTSGNPDHNKPSASVSGVSGKPGRGKTGVELRFYKRDEYRKLTPEQKMELKEYRANSGKGKGGTFNKTTTDAKRPSKQEIAAAVAHELARREENAKAETQVADDFEKYIMSIVGRTQRKPTAAAAASTDASLAKVTINSILKRAKS